MLRRHVLQAALALTATTALPRVALAAFSPSPQGWREFAVTTEITVPRNADQTAQVWVPLPSVDAGNWSRAGEVEIGGNADTTQIRTDPVYGARFLQATWAAGSEPARLTVTAQASAQDRDGPTPADLSAEDRAFWTASTDLIPTDGIVAETAAFIVGDETDPMAKARLVYDWVVENSARNPETRGCGLGDIASMLHMGDLTGKCADLNALYVGLARAADLPARDVYGLRVAPSRFGYKSLGAGSEIVTGAQHCRAEVFIDGAGWMAVDPADVRKVMLQGAPDGLPLSHPKVQDAREGLFGSWEGNWIAYNFAHDVALPGSDGPVLPFLMYPQAEVDGIRRDPLEPDYFAYTITAQELTAS
ncbi:Transglutaminase-like superfamily protein [Rhodobacteraceae bacterium THAF1]|uniref:transglutaminase-like domain-containing protein n=1 Tax=Palleronia sp. THAF1 TaxID=2587842 RepID=UPI000F406CAD|nr:transglutaminase domain-containing protein [Palleronia sp. THAF1]QFU07610.1 Transglutaminase-like superfamily protein [Palleronia sp. THAF1]VDC22818.1 Transglutaminase-like superfamily protein [Rhodobacteraceae bacterium THAF1]